MEISRKKRLSEGAITSILANLPVKSLQRFRYVHKSWDQLITSPQFIEMHRRSTENKKNECILIKHDISGSKTLLSRHSYETLYHISPCLEISSFNFIRDISFEISWPCNGLVLCVSHHTSTFVLCNPATREFNLLPPPPGFPSIKVLKFGLDFDSIRNDYKVIAFLARYMDRQNQSETTMYSLSSNSWRKIVHEMDRYIYGVDDSPVQGLPINGALHWVVDIYEDQGSILSFNVSTELFQEIELPQGINFNDENTPIDKSLTKLNECLSLFVYSVNPENMFVDIWVMNEYGVARSWTRQVSISGIMNTDIWFYPRLLWKNEVLIIESGRGKLTELKLCPLDSQDLTDTGIVSCYSSQGVVVYKESLVKPFH